MDDRYGGRSAGRTLRRAEDLSIRTLRAKRAQRRRVIRCVPVDVAKEERAGSGGASSTTHCEEETLRTARQRVLTRPL